MGRINSELLLKLTPVFPGLSRGDVDLPGCSSASAALREIDREMQPSAMDRSEAVPIF